MDHDVQLPFKCAGVQHLLVLSSYAEITKTQRWKAGTLICVLFGLKPIVPLVDPVFTPAVHWVMVTPHPSSFKKCIVARVGENRYRETSLVSSKTIHAKYLFIYLLLFYLFIFYVFIYYLFYYLFIIYLFISYSKYNIRVSTVLLYVHGVTI